MTTVSQLEVQIAADISALRRALTDANSEVMSFGQKLAATLSGVATGATNAAASLSLITEPLKQFGVDSISVAADFDSAMTEIGARTGITADELEMVRQTALQMGADTAFSAQDAADAMLELLASGANVNETMAMLPSVLDAAAASGASLGNSADTVTDIMAAFGLEASDASYIVDTLAAAAGASSADMDSLGQGFANVSGIAAQFGLDVEDVAASLAIFSENGVKGAEAGTLLKSMLLNMNRDTEDVQGMWSELGISMYDAEGSARELSDVIGDLTTVMDGMSDQERIEVLNTLGGSYGFLGLAALTSSISIDEMKARMEASADAATIADAKMDTFTGTLDSLQGSVETLQTEAFTPFMDEVLKPLAQRVTEVINSVTEWVGENGELATSIITIGAGVVAIVPILAGIGAVVHVVAGAFTVLATVFGAVTGAAGLLLSPIVGLGLAIAGLVAIVSNSEIQAGLAAWVGVFENAWMALSIVFDNLRRGIERFFLEVQIKFVEFASGFRQMVLDATGGQVDIAPDINFNLDEISQRLSDLKLADAFGAILREQVNAGDINLTAEALPVIDTGYQQVQPAYALAGREAAQAFAEGLRDEMSVTTVNAIEDSFRTALQGGSSQDIEVTWGLAEGAGLDAMGIYADVQASMEAAAMDNPAIATVMAPTFVDPTIADSASVVEGVRSQLEAMEYAASVLANVTVYPGAIKLDPVMAALGGVLPAGGFSPIPLGSSGGAGPSAGGTTVINAYGDSPYEVADMVDRAQRDRGR